MAELVRLIRDGNVGIVAIENPPVNALSPGVPEAILACVGQVMSDAALQAAVLIGMGRTFVAGFDIKEFVKITSGQRTAEVSLNPIFNAIEASPKPVIAALHGTTLGGGLELAMSCHYRVAAPGTQLGQPEVKLGLIPGGGGTQRLPRLIGPALAAQMCATGDPINAREALRIGLVDEIVEGDLLQGAVAFARGGKPVRRSRDCQDKLEPFTWVDPGLKARGREAPRRAYFAVDAAVRSSFEDGLAEEARLFNDCLYSEESKALIHVFFGEREVAKVPGVPEVKDAGIASAAIVGAGTMGGGIAMTYVNAGIPVLLKESSAEALDKGLAAIRNNYAGTVARGRLTEAEADRRMAMITPTLSYDGFAQAGIVVEAAFENLELKKQIFAGLDKATAPGAILATNTSSLNIDEIAAATSRPDRVIGHHFFSPANVMKLLEIVRGKATAPDVIGASLALARKLGKMGVVVGNCRGFVGNRMFHCYRREAQFLVEEGARIQDVDSVLYNFGMAMGPLSVGDLAGLDVGWRIRKEYAHLNKPGVRRPLMEDRLCEMGRFGQKTGAGWYRYDAKRNRTPDPEVAELAARVASEAGIAQRTIAGDEIRDRCLYALVNEGCRILEEGIAARPVDIDIIYIHGYGFPAHKGGPMKWAEFQGWRSVYERVAAFEQTHGADLWAPAPLLKKLAGA